VKHPYSLLFHRKVLRTSYEIKSPSDYLCAASRAEQKLCYLRNFNARVCEAHFCSNTILNVSRETIIKTMKHLYVSRETQLKKISLSVIVENTKKFKEEVVIDWVE